MIFLVVFYHFHFNMNVSLDRRLCSLSLLRLDPSCASEVVEESVAEGQFSEATCRV